MPTPLLMGTGLNEEVVSVIVDFIAVGRLDRAFSLATAVNNDISKNAVLIKLKGRYFDLFYDQQALYVDDEGFLNHYDRIANKFLNNIR